MKQTLLITIALIMAVVSAQAQKIIVVDTDGVPVPYASVMTKDADYIGVTNLDGVLADLKGATDITVTHVAYKTKEVRLSGGSEERITLEDADFGLTEITVTSKPLVYVQTYYRMYAYDEKDGMVYYRVGLTDNAYDREKQKVSASTKHVAKASIGIIKTALGLFGSIFDDYSKITERKVEDKMKDWGKDINLKIVEQAPGRKAITDLKGIVGSIVDDHKDGVRRFSYNSSLIAIHRLEAEGKEKKLEKRAKREEKKKNKMESDFILYRIDEDGNYAPEDFIMKENLDSYDVLEDGEWKHKIFCIQVFTTDRAYVTKEELKQIKKDNKMKMTYDNIQQFERQHNIPALAPGVQKKLKEVWKVDDSEE